jgi:hypothetical protein
LEFESWRLRSDKLNDRSENLSAEYGKYEGNTRIKRKPPTLYQVPPNDVMQMLSSPRTMKAPSGKSALSVLRLLNQFQTGRQGFAEDLLFFFFIQLLVRFHHLYPGRRRFGLF